jgi:hypothetical protein
MEPLLLVAMARLIPAMTPKKWLNKLLWLATGDQLQGYYAA